MGTTCYPDRRTVTRHVFDGEHPTMGLGTIIEVIHCNPKDRPTPETNNSFRFFPRDITLGTLYQANRPYKDGNFDAFCELHGLEDIEVSDRNDIVRNFSNFQRYENSAMLLDSDDADSTRFRCRITVTHILAYSGALVKLTPFEFAGPWVTAPSSAVGADVAHLAWKSNFFAKFPGCNCKMKGD